MLKSEKIQKDIEALLDKKSSLQDRINDLEKQKLAAVNAELLSEVRALSCSPIELKNIIAAIKGQDYEALKSYRSIGG